MRRIFYQAALIICFVLSSGLSAAQIISVEGENYTEVTGSTKLELENSGNSIGYFDEDGETLSYSIDVPAAGFYEFSFKYLSGDAGEIVVITAQDAEGIIPFEGVVYPGGDWWEMPISDWPSTNQSPMFYFEAGTQTLYLKNKGVGFNIDNFEITYSSNQSATVDHIEISPDRISIKPFHTVTLSAQAFTANNEIIAVPLTWSSNVVDGVYSAGDIGSDIITVSSENVTQETTVKIEMPTPKREFTVNRSGFLKTQGKGLANENGEMVSFGGPSWYWHCSAPKYWTPEAVRYFVDEWHSGMIRLPMSIAPGLYDDHGTYTGDTWNQSNYYQSPEYSMNLMKAMIDAAIENDIYVIIDFHEHWAHKPEIKEKAIEFFSEIAELYGDYPNILYEIFNEPLNNTSNQIVADYANEIIPVIRQHDTDNIIIVGSTWWSQQPCGVEPLIHENLKHNVAYTLHYYAATHNTSLLGNMTCGVPVVVTECGNDGGSMWDYIDACKANGIPNMSWAVNDKHVDGDEKWSIFKKNGNYDATTWTDNDLSSPGLTQKGIVKGWLDYGPTEFEDCTDDVIQSIEITTPQTSVLQNEMLNLNVIGHSSCQELPVSNPQWSSNAPGGVFSSGALGQFSISVEAEGFSDEIIISVVKDNSTLISNSEEPNKLSLMNTGWYSFSDENSTVSDVQMTSTGANNTENGTMISYTGVSGGADCPEFIYGDGYSYPIGTVVLYNGQAYTSLNNDANWAYPDASDAGWAWEPGGDCGSGDIYAGLGFDMEEDGSVFDLTGSTGISFYHKGPACQLEVKQSAVTDYAYYMASVPSHSTWTKVTLNWGDFSQPSDWGISVPWDASDILGFQWKKNASDGESDELWIDQVKIEGLVFDTPIQYTSSNDLLSEKIDLEIYPNPFNEEINISGLSASVKEVEIFSLDGSLVGSFRTEGANSLTINVSYLPKGLYLVRISGESMKSQFYKAIKR
jgi:hypothetical protein